LEILVGSYTEKDYQAIPSVRLSDEEYGRGLLCFVPACADIVPIDEAKRIIYLARRASKPMVGWWWIGGRMAPHETKEEAAVGNFKRETGIELSRGRLKLATILDYRWEDRAQEPQEVGCHMLAYTFTVELTEDELASSTAFNRKRLVAEKVFPAIFEICADAVSEPEFRITESIETNNCSSRTFVIP